MRHTRRLALSTGFLLLAAGGTAACDDAPAQPEAVEETHVFYCVTTGDVIVDDGCGDDDDDDSDFSGGMYVIAHAPVDKFERERRPLKAGQKLPANVGWQRFPSTDTAARQAWKLPTAGKITNGATIKVNVLGKGGPPVAGGSKAGG